MSLVAGPTGHGKDPRRGGVAAATGMIFFCDFEAIFDGILWGFMGFYGIIWDF